MSVAPSASYRLGRSFSLHFDGVEACLYSADRVSGTVLRGLAARMADELWHHGERHGVISGELFAAQPLGIPGDRWVDMAAELCRRGALEPADAPPAVDIGSPGALSSVRVEAPQRLRAQTVALLSGCGAEVTTTEPAGRPSAPRELLVLVDDRFDVARHRELNRRATLGGALFLSLRLSSRTFEIGPLVLPGMSACFECYWQRLQAPFVEDGPPPWVADSTPRGCFLDASRVGGLIASSALHTLALEVQRVLGGSPPTTLGGVVSVDLDEIRTHRRRVLEVPGCGSCALAVPRT